MLKFKFQSRECLTKNKKNWIVQVEKKMLNEQQLENVFVSTWSWAVRDRKMKIMLFLNQKKWITASHRSVQRTRWRAGFSKASRLFYLVKQLKANFCETQKIKWKRQKKSCLNSHETTSGWRFFLKSFSSSCYHSTPSAIVFFIR